MRIVVCYKWVLDEADIKVDSNGGLDFRDVSTKLSLYDKNAIEAAVSFVEENEGECISLTFGGKDIASSKKEVLSRGPNSGYYISDELADSADPYVTANVLAAAIKDIGDVDLVITGEGASDDYAQQVGPRIAQKLGIPVVAYAASVKPDDGGIKVERLVDEGIETLAVNVPTLITMLGDCNAPRIPALKQILGAGKKEFTEMSLDSLGLSDTEKTPRDTELGVVGNSQNRKQIKVDGDVEQAADELIRQLVQEGVLG